MEKALHLVVLGLMYNKDLHGHHGSTSHCLYYQRLGGKPQFKRWGISVHCHVVTCGPLKGGMWDILCYKIEKLHRR
jgi:hypothetical protein